MTTNNNQPQHKVIIIGATSGIGLALADLYAQKGFIVGVTGRRLDRLKEFQKKHLGSAFIKQMDVTNPVKACIQLDHLISSMEGMDTLIISSGVGALDSNLDWELSEPTIATNISGFTAIANHAMKYFINKQEGTLAAITSIASLTGSHIAPTYSASKAYQSNYLQGLRAKASKLQLSIPITEIRAGFVDTKMAKGDGKFWVAPRGKTAIQIKRAIDKQRALVYVTKRWRLIAWLIKLLPNWLLLKL